MGALRCTRFFTGFGAMAGGCTAATTGAGVVTLGLAEAGALMFEAAFDPFEQPLVMSRKTPEMAVTAIKAAPKRALSLDRDFVLLVILDFFGSCGLLLR
jgi:hypothetical protein